jgi:hypothetical protein
VAALIYLFDRIKKGVHAVSCGYFYKGIDSVSGWLKFQGRGIDSLAVIR